MWFSFFKFVKAHLIAFQSKPLLVSRVQAHVLGAKLIRLLAVAAYSTLNMVGLVFGLDVWGVLLGHFWFGAVVRRGFLCLSFLTDWTWLQPRVDIWLLAVLRVDAAELLVGCSLLCSFIFAGTVRAGHFQTAMLSLNTFLNCVLCLVQYVILEWHLLCWVQRRSSRSWELDLIYWGWIWARGFHFRNQVSVRALDWTILPLINFLYLFDSWFN